MKIRIFSQPKLWGGGSVGTGVWSQRFLKLTTYTCHKPSSIGVPNLTVTSRGPGGAEPSGPSFGSGTCVVLDVAATSPTNWISSPSKGGASLTKTWGWLRSSSDNRSISKIPFANGDTVTDRSPPSIPSQAPAFAPLSF